MPYSSQYPGGWRNLPDTSTPIMAAACDGWDSGIAAAQSTADTALAASGDGLFAIPGLALDGVTDDGPAIQAALEDVEDGARGGTLLVTGDAGKVCYINSTVTISRSGTKLGATGGVEFLFGPDARIRPWGTIDEQPTANPDKPALTADAAMGATVLHVDQIPAGWAAGIYVGIRGKRTASGAVPNEEIFHSYVASINVGALTITLTDPLPKQFKALWDTTWSNKKSQVTKVTQARLTGSPDAGDVLINCDDTSVFQVGDIVQVLDDVHTLDGDGTVQVGNFAHKETNQVAEIINGTSLKLSAGLQHTYDTGSDAHIQKLNALEDAEMSDWVIRWAAQEADGEHAIEVRYAHNTHVRRVHIIGGNTGGFSWSGHAIRFTDSLACSASGGVISQPKDVTAGRGYGVSFYGSTSCWVESMRITGTRHSVLWFNGAANCGAKGVISTDARISDFDWHGAACHNNWTNECTAIGGTRFTDDSTSRTAWKWGNPSHRPGDSGNVATSSLVVNYAGIAVEGIPTSGENIWQGTVRGAQTGVRLRTLPDDATQPMLGFVIRDSDFYDVATPLDIDGGTSDIVTKLVIDSNRWTRCGAFVIANAPRARFVGNRVIDTTATGFIFTATSSPNIQVKGNDFSNAVKGISLTGCPDARITRNDLHDMTNSLVFHDGGGNNGFAFVDNRALGFSPTADDGGSPSTGLLELTPGTGGGGGGGTYPPLGGVPYADLSSSLQAMISSGGSSYPPSGGVPLTDLSSAVQTSLGKADSAYQKPSGGIPNSDLATPGGTSSGYSPELPSERSYSEWNYQPELATSSTAPSAGVLSLVRLRVRSSGAQTAVVLSVATAGSGMTAAYAGVYDAAGNQIAVTGDVSTSLSSTGVKKLTTAAGYTLTAGQDVYVGVLCVGGTPPSFHRAATSAPLSNAGLNAGAGYRYMTLGSGLTTMPSTVTTSSGSSSSNTFWAAVT